MPELPEVETIVRDLRRAGLIGRRIRGLRLDCPKIIAGCAPRGFAARLRGRTIRGLCRRAKFIVFQLSGGVSLLVHLRMTGQFALAAPGEPRVPHERLALLLAGRRELRYLDTRKFGRWRLLRHPETVLRRLGPEPLAAGLRPADFAARLAARRRLLKPLLLDQYFLAGLGNIYVDEALWEARLHPRRRADTLGPAAATRLLRAVRKVLRRGIRCRGTSLGVSRANFADPAGRRGHHQDFLRVYGQTGRPCRRCGAAIRRLVVGQRGTHVCPACQPTPPAPRRRPRAQPNRSKKCRPGAP